MFFFGGGRGGGGGGESDLGPEILTMHQPLITFPSLGFYFTMYTTSFVAQIYLNLTSITGIFSK